jgi:ribosomally synthesized peptide (two-chain TOMM family)
VNNASVSEMQQFGAVWPQCVARAWEDAQFREALKRDPAGTLLKDYQFPVPQEVNLQVVEGDEVQQAEAANTLRLVIPPMPDLDMREIALVGAKDGATDTRFNFRFTITSC